MQDKALRKQAELALALWNDLQEVVAGFHPADEALKGVFRQHRELGSRDRRFLNAILFAAFRWKGWLTGCPPAQQLALAWALDAPEDHPACAYVYEAETYPASGILSLEEKSARLKEWLGLKQAPQAAELIPEWLATEWADDADPLDTYIPLLQHRPPVVLRCRAKADTSGFEQIPPLKEAYFSDNTREVTERLQKYPAGLLVQNVASQCVGHICRPSPGSNWWDACSGAGGKSIHLADLMQGRGRLWTTDTRRPALNELHRRSKVCGIDMIRSRKFDVLKDDIPQAAFDGVLLDAPCSGLGTWTRNPDARWRTDPSRIAQSARRQGRMLQRVADALRPGGRLIYSVCTLTTKETTEVVQAFLDARPDFELAPVDHPLAPEQRSGMQWILPSQAKGDAMFVAHFRKSK